MALDVDTLTGVGTRTALKQALEKAIGREDYVALAVLDVDHFHEINVQFGQETGDQVLRTAVELMQEVSGGVYRLSGDEFAILLPGVSLEQAFLRMEALRVRTQGAAAGFDLPDQRTVTITIGVAQYPRDSKDATGLLKAAEAGLHAAKEAGRNQVGLAPNEEMVMKSCYYPSPMLRKLKGLAERLDKKESVLLREALSDLLRKYDQPLEGQ